MQRYVSLLFILSLLFLIKDVSPQAEAQDNVPLVNAVPIAIHELTPLGTVHWNQNGDGLETAKVIRQQNGYSIAFEAWQPLSAYTPIPNGIHESGIVADDVDLLAFSPDGTRLAGLSPSSLVIFDTVAGLPLFVDEGAPVGFVSWSPDSSQVVVRSLIDYFSFDLVDIEQEKRIGTYHFFEGSRTAPGAILYNVSWGSPREVAVIGADNHRAVLNLETNTIVDVSDCCLEGAYELQWQPNGRLIATHDRVYNLDSHKVVFTYPTQNRIFWNGDGQWLIGTKLNGTGIDLSLISISEQRVVSRFTTDALGGGHVVTGAYWSPSGDYIALLTYATITNLSTAEYQTWVSIWDIRQILMDSGYRTG